MKKLSIVTTLFVFVSLFLSACRLGFGFSPGFDMDINIEPDVNPEISLTYTIVRETEVYPSLRLDAEPVAVLSVGTEVKPTDGETSLECETITDEGIAYSLCKIEVVGSDVTGWVLEETLSK